jgi:uncharacterized protein (TIGR02145 family)
MRYIQTILKLKTHFMKTLRYIFVTLIFTLSVVALFAQGNMTIQGGGTVTINGNLIITPTAFVCGNPMTDFRDGKTYTTIQIGTQCWMAQNLNIGTFLSHTSGPWDNGIIEKRCYDDLESNCDIYGGLYTWDEMMQYIETEGTVGICPNGWHIPSITEFVSLINFLGGSSIAGGKMKETGTTHWLSPNTGATNISGFTALPGGYLNQPMGFFHLSEGGMFWSSSLEQDSFAIDFTLWYTSEALPVGGGVYRFESDAVRCLKD